MSPYRALSVTLLSLSRPRLKKAMELLFPHLSDRSYSSGLARVIGPIFKKINDTVIDSELTELSTLSTVKQVTLCKELSDLTDYIIEGREPENIHSIEIYSDRPFFLYQEDKQVSVACGNFNSSVYITNDRIGKKVRTYVSIVDIYDRYGIEPCCSFVLTLYDAVRASIYPATYLLRYVLGSIAVLDPVLAGSYLSDCEERSVSSMLWTAADCLIGMLVKRDAEHQPKMIHELETVTLRLPDELLALIFRSRRVTKTTSGIFISSRHKRNLRQGELEARSTILPMLCVNDCVFVSLEADCCLCAKDDSKASLHRSSYDISLEEGTSDEQGSRVCVYLYSWTDYARISQRSVKEVFFETVSRVDLSNIKHLCAWIMCMFSSRDLKKSLDLPSLQRYMKITDTTQEDLSHSELLKIYNDLYSQIVDEYSL